MKPITVERLVVVDKHPYLRALLDIQWRGLRLRGLRLEERAGGKLSLGYPGRKIQKSWQVVYQATNPTEEQLLLDQVEEIYRARMGRRAA